MNQGVDDLALNFTLTLFQNEISFVVKGNKENLKTANYLFEKILDIETLKGFSKYFTVLDVKKFLILFKKVLKKNMIIFL